LCRPGGAGRGHDVLRGLRGRQRRQRRHLHIWCDNPGAETEEQVGAAAYERLRGAGQNGRNSPKLVSRYNQFKPIIDAVGRAPGYGEHLN
jgi:hexosaminidase